MDEIEDNNKLPELPLGDEDKDDDSFTTSYGDAMKDRENDFDDEDLDSKNSYGGDYLNDNLLDFDNDDYDWGNAEETEELLGYLRDKPTLLEKFNAALRDINTEKDLEKKEKKIRGYKSILRDTVDQLKIRDKLNEDAWDEELNLKEFEKLLWEQKINNVNSALKEYNVRLDPFDKRLYDYLNENLTETFTTGDEGKNLVKNINGYKYAGKKIIQRRKDKTFYGLDNKEFNNFLERMKRFTATSARSELIDYLNEDQNIQITARDCIEELRNEEKKIIGNAKNNEDMNEARNEINKIEGEIDNLKNNRKFNFNKNIIERTLQGKLSKFKGWIKENETTLGVGGTSLILSIVSGLATSIPLIEKLKDAAKYAKKVGKGIEKFGKKVTLIGNKMDSIFKEPTKAVGAMVGLTGSILNDIVGVSSHISVPLILITILILIIYFINKWIGVF